LQLRRIWQGCCRCRRRRRRCRRRTFKPPQGSAAPRAAHSHALHIPSGGGFLLPFFLGVIDMLYRDLGVLRYTYPVAGGSTGSIATA
jgi:hypothetical protein